MMQLLSPHRNPVPPPSRGRLGGGWGQRMLRESRVREPHPHPALPLKGRVYVSTAPDPPAPPDSASPSDPAASSPRSTPARTNRAAGDRTSADDRGPLHDDA